MEEMRGVSQRRLGPSLGADASRMMAGGFLHRRGGKQVARGMPNEAIVVYFELRTERLSSFAMAGGALAWEKRGSRVGRKAAKRAGCELLLMN